MKCSDAIDKIAPALVAVQTEVEAVTKDSTNPHFKNRYASLEAITEYVRPILARHGLACIQGGGDLTNGGLIVSTTMLHESGQWISASFELPVEKGTPQAAGSSITYGRRYGLSAFLALTTEDDDGNAGSARPAPAAKSTSNGTADFHSFLMPMGKSKGKMLKDLDTKDLESAVDWAAEKGKFEEFQAAGEKELESRKSESLDFDGAYA